MGSGSFCGRNYGGPQRRRFLVEIAEEVIQRLVDFHVHIHRGMDLDGIDFDVNASAKKYNKGEE